MVLAADVRPENGKVPATPRYSRIPPGPRRAITALAVLLAAGFAGGAMAQEASPAGITVQGQGEVSVRADRARVTIGVVERADTAAAATDALNAALAAALDALAAAGVAQEDLSTTSLRLDPVRSYDDAARTDRIDGYEASSTIELTVSDLDRLGPLLDAAVTAGANQIASLTFETSREEALQAEARRAAVADARARAELYADASGLALGPLLSLSEGGDGGFQPVMRMSMEDAGTPIVPGDLTLSSTITTRWAIGDDN